jgi:DNA-binding MarR family transcriptional regulator
MTTPCISADSERAFDTDAALKIINAVERDSATSQRALANEAGIAVGLVNTYVKRCLRKGWIKVHQAPARRFLYYITPTGFSEKARLTAEYLTASFDMFRTARGQCDALVGECAARGYTRIVLAGAGDLAEIAALSGLGANIEIVGVIDPTSNQAQIAGIPVLRSFEGTVGVDAVIVTDIRTPQATFDRLASSGSGIVVLTPPMLRINTNGLALEDGEDGVAS